MPIEHWKKNTLGEWKQVRRDLEPQRRKEIYETQKIVRAEKAEREQKEEEHKLMLSRRRQDRLERKKAQEASPPPLRRSARVHSKSSNDPLTRYKRGSMYTKTA